MFIDEATIIVRGGSGGAGAVSFFPGKNGPDGGNGGNGGAVYAQINQHMISLHKYIEKHTFEAGAGKRGENNRKNGANGHDITLDFPAGTSCLDLNTNEEFEITPANSPLLIARGGAGGLGNDAFKSSTNRTPKQSTPGKPGQDRHLRVILRLIADYGLIGLPNAGKSSLLNELTATHVKTADYPFTTLEPNLGALHGRILADIPGLIEGASEGKGLGIRFLKHIEKVKLLLHCIGADSEHIIEDYQTVTHELRNYNAHLAQKPSIILLTKSDLLSKEDLKQKEEILKQFGLPIYSVSIHDWDALQKLKKLLLE